jgi:transcriptional regulator with XRE-family HTH domain
MTCKNHDWVNRQQASDEDRREYERERLILWTTELLAELMEQTGTSKADLARKLGVSRAHITQMLSGARNVTLSTLADASWALGKRAVVKLEPLRSNEFISSPVHAVTHGAPRVVEFAKKGCAPAGDGKIEAKDAFFAGLYAGVA